MTRELRHIHADDIVENAGRVDLIDFQRDRDVVVFRNARGTKAVLHMDDATGAAQITAHPENATAYELLLGPDVPFTVLITLMEHL